MFSILTLNVTRSMVMNTKQLSKSEIEYNAIALAKSEIERAQWASKNELDPNSSDYIFENYTQDDPHKETLELGSSGQFKIDFYIYVTIDKNITVPGSTTTNRKVTVHVTSPFFHEEFNKNTADYPITMDFVAAFEE